MKNGLFAGFVATAVLSAIMVMKSIMGVMPDVNAIKMMAGMMLVVMPITGAGLFGLNIGPHATLATLMLHVIFGAVLGTVYGDQRTTLLASVPLDEHGWEPLPKGTAVGVAEGVEFARRKT